MNIDYFIRCFFQYRNLWTWKIVMRTFFVLIHLILPSKNAIVILRWNDSSSEQYDDEWLECTCVVVSCKNDGDERKIIMFEIIDENVWGSLLESWICLTASFEWYGMLVNWILLISPWRWRIFVVEINGTRQRERTRFIWLSQ